MRNRLLSIFILLSFSVKSQNNDAAFVKDNYTKIDTTITMRDGVKLYTVIYVPKDQSQKYPFLMERTPYSAGPYGKDNFARRLGPNSDLMKEKYIFVYQDVRGRYMSEGHNLEVTPYIANKKSNKDVDESSDTYDTVDWLTKNVQGNNGRVGIYGISYPGFYSTTSLPGAHPAIKAVSPQAPVTDEFVGDDANHNGAFFFLDNFDFMNSFGKERSGPVMNYGGSIFKGNEPDMYKFFLTLEPLKVTNSEKYFNHRSYIWDEYLAHDTYDSYWKARNIRQHLKNITIPTLVVGGWFDAEDLFGSLHTYEAIEKQSPKNNTKLVMGPWTHGDRSETRFGDVEFGAEAAIDSWAGDWRQYRLRHFDSVIRGTPNPEPPVRVFVMGGGSGRRNAAGHLEHGGRWIFFNDWPAPDTDFVPYHLHGDGRLDPATPDAGAAPLSYDYDPAHPVPTIGGNLTSLEPVARGGAWDQVESAEFFGCTPPYLPLASRPDVLVFQTPPLTAPLQIVGPI